MKKLGLYLFFVSMTGGLFITSCSSSDDDKDTTRPVIASDFTPAENSKFITGIDDIIVKAEVSDNVELSTYKIEIHDASDGHNHTKSAVFGTKGIETEVPFKAFKQGSLSGKTAVIRDTISVPLIDPKSGHYIQKGEYHLVLYVLDKAGNQTEAVRDIELVRP